MEIIVVINRLLQIVEKEESKVILTDLLRELKNHFLGGDELQE